MSIFRVINSVIKLFYVLGFLPAVKSVRFNVACAHAQPTYLCRNTRPKRMQPMRVHTHIATSCILNLIDCGLKSALLKLCSHSYNKSFSKLLKRQTNNYKNTKTIPISYECVYGYGYKNLLYISVTF